MARRTAVIKVFDNGTVTTSFEDEKGNKAKEKIHKKPKPNFKFQWAKQITVIKTKNPTCSITINLPGGGQRIIYYPC